MKLKPISIYNKQEGIKIIFKGLLKDELIRLASLDGFNNEPVQWFRSYLKNLWKLK